MGNKQPQPTETLVKRLQRVAKHLESRIDPDDANPDEGAQAEMRARANTCWQAAARLEKLASQETERTPTEEYAVVPGDGAPLDGLRAQEASSQFRHLCSYHHRPITYEHPPCPICQMREKLAEAVDHRADWVAPDAAYELRAWAKLIRDFASPPAQKEQR